MSLTSNEISEETLNTTELTTNDCHRLLAVERRRLAIEILSKATSTVDLDKLATEIVAREDGLALDERAKERVAVTLHHVHLPKMAAAGLLEYDPGTHAIDLAEPLQFH